mgnify:CR=1 FL=1
MKSIRPLFDVVRMQHYNEKKLFLCFVCTLLVWCLSTKRRSMAEEGNRRLARGSFFFLSVPLHFLLLWENVLGNVFSKPIHLNSINGRILSASDTLFSLKNWNISDIRHKIECMHLVLYYVKLSFNIETNVVICTVR